jgi:hypothetical protein
MEGGQSFRVWEFIEHFSDENANFYTARRTMNLREVKGFCDFEFPIEHPMNGGKLVRIDTVYGDSYVAQISYEDFRKLYFAYLQETDDIDMRSMVKKKKG